MVADLSEGTLIDGKQRIQISESLLGKITFVREGHFSKNTGAPTLRLIGDVEAVGSHGTTLKKGVVTKADLVDDFVAQKITLDPAEYIRFAVEGSSGAWLPIRYFALQAKMTTETLIKFINERSASPDRKKLFIQRIRKSDAAFHFHSGRIAAITKTIMTTGKAPPITGLKEAGDVALAIQGLTKTKEVTLEGLLQILGECVKLAQGQSASHVRRAICRVDEIYFELPKN